MNSRTAIQEELQALESTMPPGLPMAPYAVPQGYFESFPALVLARIQTEGASAEEEISSLSPLLAGLSRKMPFALPPDYFSQSSEDLQSLAAPEASSLLSLISKEIPYEVPAGYFARFPDRMLEKAADRAGAKVVPMRRRWMQLAAAALIGGIITISGITYFNSQEKGSVAAAGINPIAQDLKKVSTEELDAFLKTTDINGTGGTVAVKAKAAPLKSKDPEPLLEDVSDHDLDAFLDQMPVDEEELGIN